MDPHAFSWPGNDVLCQMSLNTIGLIAIHRIRESYVDLPCLTWVHLATSALKRKPVCFLPLSRQSKCFTNNSELHLQGLSSLPFRDIFCTSTQAAQKYVQDISTVASALAGDISMLRILKRQLSFFFWQSYEQSVISQEIENARRIPNVAPFRAKMSK